MGDSLGVEALVSAIFLLSLCLAKTSGSHLCFFFFFPWRMPSPHSPFAILNGASISQRGDLRNSGVPVYLFIFLMSCAPVFIAAAQGTPLVCLALEAMGTSVPGSHKTVTKGDILLSRLPPPGSTQTAD